MGLTARRWIRKEVVVVWARYIFFVIWPSSYLVIESRSSPNPHTILAYHIGARMRIRNVLRIKNKSPLLTILEGKTNAIAFSVNAAMHLVSSQVQEHREYDRIVTNVDETARWFAEERTQLMPQPPNECGSTS